jgi:hypothetical protein
MIQSNKNQCDEHVEGSPRTSTDMSVQGLVIELLLEYSIRFESVVAISLSDYVEYSDIIWVAD